jgi:hypothetical protein
VRNKLRVMRGRPAPRMLAFAIKLAFPLILLFLGSDLLGQNTPPTEAQVEAAYLFNFGKFVTWPAADRAPALFTICILGKDPFGETLDSIVAGESIGQKPIKVQRILSMQDAGACNILFVASSEDWHLEGILQDSRKLHLLTVSNIRHFAEAGGIIGLVRQEDRVRFEVNRTAAEQSRLLLSSELLKVAVRVIQQKRTQD